MATKQLKSFRESTFCTSHARKGRRKVSENLISSVYIPTIQALASSTIENVTLASELLVACTTYVGVFEKYLKDHGKRRTCEHFKSLNTFAHAKALKKDDLPIIPWCKTIAGYPKQIVSFRTYLESGDPNQIRIVLSVTRGVYESIYLPPIWDEKPITDPGKPVPKNLRSDLCDFSQRWVKKLRQPPQKLIRDQVTGSMTRGPNGPSILTSHYDASSLVQTHSSEADHLTNLATLTGNKWISDMFRHWGTSITDASYVIGKLALLQESGGKTRVIAIGDYWSQNILRSIHDHLMSILRRMVTDGTYNQEEQTKRLVRLSLGKETFCYDLTKATDRFPVEIQEDVLSHVFTKDIANAWRNVLTSRQFKYKQHMVSWKRGQPLGMLSSWAAFSLTHHMVIEYCAHLEGIKTFRDYAVLGDDVCIWDRRVAHRYESIMGDLDVSINHDKSVIGSKATHRVEFAKRIFIHGVEVSGLKYDLIKSSRTLAGYIEMMNMVIRRGWVPVNVWNFPRHHCADKHKEELLKFILWFNSKCVDAPQFAGMTSRNINYTITRDEVNREVVLARILNLRKKQETLDKILDGNKPISEMFSREGVRVPVPEFGPLDSYSNSPISLHPLVWTLNQIGEELWSKLEILETLPTEEEFGSLISLPDLSEIEYLPIPENGVFFGDRHKLKTKAHVTFVVKAYMKIKKLHETNGS
jgi:uncharacterized protein (DUF2344 family)